MYAAEIKVSALAIDKYQTIIGRPINTSAWRKPDMYPTGELYLPEPVS
jgi:hypothetical protein